MSLTIENILDILQEQGTGSVSGYMFWGPEGTMVTIKTGDFGEMKIRYDTGQEPQSSVFEAILQVTESDGNILHFKVSYVPYSYYLPNQFENVEAVLPMTEEEAEEFIRRTTEFYKPYWKPIN